MVCLLLSVYYFHEEWLKAKDISLWIFNIIIMDVAGRVEYMFENLALTTRKSSTLDVLQNYHELEQSMKSKFLCMSMIIVGYVIFCNVSRSSSE